MTALADGGVSITDVALELGIDRRNAWSISTVTPRAREIAFANHWRGMVKTTGFATDADRWNERFRISPAALASRDCRPGIFDQLETDPKILRRRFGRRGRPVPLADMALRRHLPLTHGGRAGTAHMVNIRLR
jgi:hypothetical protein